MSAIWLLPAIDVYEHWPKSGEIDILEIVGFDPCTAHFTVQTERYHFKIGTEKDAFTEGPYYSILVAL